MKVAISIEHPAWAHQFKNIIKKNDEDDTLVLAVDKDGDLRLLDSFGIKYKKMANSTGTNVIEKGFLFIKLCITYTLAIKKFKPDILIGRASPMMAVAAKINGIPHVLFEDTEVSKFSLNICKKYSRCILTPQTFLMDLGEKQIRMPIYKELFYLHPDVFTPDENIVKDSGIDIDKPYVIVRFIAWNASHDVGKKGITGAQKIDFIKELAKLCKVYISSESELPDELREYELKCAYESIHHVLYYATVVISEGASMASEAAILGTHAFYLNEIASGTTEEQEERFNLLRVMHDPNTRYDKALEETRILLEDKELWNKGKEKRDKIIREMPNPNDIFYMKMEELVR